jgi:hypothetical protein
MPPTIFKTLPTAALALTVVPVTSAATIETLTSPTLEIELSASPFSYRVLERSTGEVLMSQTGATAQEACSDSDETISCREFLDRKRNDARQLW